MKKSGKFYLSIILNIAEGMLSGFNFLLLYQVMRMLWDKTVSLSSLYRLGGFLAIIFALRLVIYSVGYTEGQIGGAKVSNHIRLFLGDKIKRIPL